MSISLRIITPPLCKGHFADDQIIIMIIWISESNNHDDYHLISNNHPSLISNNHGIMIM